MSEEKKQPGRIGYEACCIGTADWDGECEDVKFGWALADAAVRADERAKIKAKLTGLRDLLTEVNYRHAVFMLDQALAEVPRG